MSFDVNKEYSLSMALRNRHTGEVKIIATGRHTRIEKVEYIAGVAGPSFYYNIYTFAEIYASEL